jgi:hypothetical protein
MRPVHAHIVNAAWLFDGTDSMEALIKHLLVSRHLPAGFTIGKLRPEHAHIVNAVWSLGGTDSTEVLIKHLVERLPSVCIYNEDGAPVSWSAMWLDGSSAMGE